MLSTEHADAKPRILLADDEAVIAMQLAELIQAEGYEVAAVVGTAAEAVAQAHALKPDLVLMDIVMPGDMDGIDACALIQRDLNIPVVLLTAHGEEHFLRRARAALPSAYLLKPCQNTQIRAAVEVALAMRAHADPAAGFRLREAHHRIMNSFSLLHSLLRVQEIQTPDPAARHALAGAGARVQALARAHETLSNGSAEAARDGGTHVASLARSLFEAQAPEGLRLELDLGQLEFRPSQVVPCGIFLAEALTNAIKHAFSPGSSGVIRVSLVLEDGHGVLAVADNGSGFDGDPQVLRRGSFGLQCLQAAALQMDGSLHVSSAPGQGSTFAVRFPVV